MSELVKRAAPEEAPASPTGAIVEAKRQRRDDEIVPAGISMSSSISTKVAEGPARTSALLAPTMLLTGHADQVFTLRFNPAGDLIATGSFDKTILVYRVYGECENVLQIKGHKNAVLELHWLPDGERLVSCSPDRTARVWDAETGRQLKRMAEHSEIVNSCRPLRRGGPLVVTGSDDGTAKVWDLRAKRSVATVTERYQILATAWAEAGDQIYTAGIENVVRAWDLRRNEAVMTLEGHADSVTGLDVAPGGTHLLSNGADGVVREWDVRPYAPRDRCCAAYRGATHDFERNLLRCAYSPDGTKLVAGSADRLVRVWERGTARQLYVLPGHTGSVNEVVFHPTEPIVASAGSDKQVFMGELASASAA